MTSSAPIALLIFLGSFLFISVAPKPNPHLVTFKLRGSDLENPPPDTTVNYCSLIRAAYFYGEKAADKPTQLSNQDVKYFNENWSKVFNVASYQTGITATEFSATQRFSEGNRTPFPPSVRYHPKNPDTYLLFHVAKEVGKIKSKAYEQCPSCVTESLNKINLLLQNTSLQGQIAQIWLGTGTLRPLLSVQDITDFWLFLRCLSIDDRVNPISQSFFVSLGPVVKCPDTTVIKCKDEIKPKVTVGYRHCDIGGRIDTIGPMIVKGIDNCPGTVYRYKFVATDQCQKKDSSYQYFKIKNDPPEVACPKDTVVDCIKNLVVRKLKYITSCELPVKFTTKGPLLSRGQANCPNATYKMEYAVTDTCGRQAVCTQTITIKNDPPKIKCPPDTIVECSKDIKERKIEYTVSCFSKAEVKASAPKLITGIADCNGSVYEITYTVKDSCNRTATCTQKFTIRNTGPEIECPPNVEVQCFEDINVGPPDAVRVSCDLHYSITMSDPKLIMGKHNCNGAAYVVIYTVTDDCGRTDECEQLFTILQPELSIQCPPDLTVECRDEIKPSEALVKIACKRNYTVNTSGPTLVSGKENCPGAQYAIIYTVSDECGVEKECTQLFTINNPDPEIVCGLEVEIECDTVFDMMTPVPIVSCDLGYNVNKSKPGLVSGIEDCDGARYKITYTVQDECGRSSTCDQFFRLKIPPPEIVCPPDSFVECEEKIIPGIPAVKTYCDLTFRLDRTGPTLLSGKKNCPGAQYVVSYTATDECGHSVSCSQKFIIENQPPQVYCYADQMVACEEDIKPAPRDVYISCDSPFVKTTGPVLVSGIKGCPNAVYEVTYSISDKCGRKKECKQKFTLAWDDLVVTCPRDTTVLTKADIKPFPVDATTSCNVKVTVESSPPKLISGTDNLPGSVYAITYIVKDACGRQETCIQRFTVLGLTDNCRIECDCYKQINSVSLEHLLTSDDRFNRDVAALIKKYGCKKVKEWAQSGLVDLWNGWSAAEILGSQTGIATDIARRGDINIVMQNLGNINKLIEVLEEAINGSPQQAMEKVAEIAITDGVTYLTGSGTPALVFTSIKTLGDFAKYLNKEILILNIRTLADYADKDPCFFDPDHFLVTYLKVNEIRPGHPLPANAVKIYAMIRDFAQFQTINIKLVPVEELWNNPQNIIHLRIVTNKMLHEVCEYWCFKLTLKKNLNKLVQEQNLLVRFRDIIKYLNHYDCNGNENPCTMAHAELVLVNGVYECHCESGYKWDPGKIRCIPFQDCSALPHSTEVYFGDHYECECTEGYEWNADHTQCVAAKPDCSILFPNSEAVYSTQTNKYECQCISGYEWNADHTACIIPVPDCAYYLNSVAIWNAANNRYECNCPQGYEWNADHTACVPSRPECNAYYPNTVAVWNPATNQYECNCIQGYQWNATRTACELAPPDCNAYYPNTVAMWNPATNQYECNCLQGYEWNATRTGCQLTMPDCNSYYPNTIATWNYATNQYECNCLPGFQWNATRTGCEALTPDCNSYYPNSIAVWNPATNQFECYCLTGFEWNATRTACVASGNRDNVVVNPQQQKTGKCNVSYGSGANEPEQYTIDVQSTNGSLQFTYNTYTVKDRIHVYYGGSKIFDTGCVGTSGSQTFMLNGFSSIFTIIVDPLCDPNESNTQWEFTLGCPQ